jgi:hypothetical protein
MNKPFTGMSLPPHCTLAEPNRAEFIEKYAIDPEIVGEKISVSPRTFEINWDEGRDECAEVEIKFSFNPKVINKNFDPLNLTKYFKDSTGTVQNLKDHILAGHAITGAWFGGQSRSKDNVTQNGLVGFDIDKSDISWEEVKNNRFCQNHAILAYTTPSHTEENPRYRIFCRLPDGVDREIYAAICRWGFEHLTGCDPACKDQGRAFFGNTGAKFHEFNPQNIISPEIIAECKRKAQIEQERQALKRKKQQEWLDSQNLEDKAEQARKALFCIPPRGTKGSGTYKICLESLWGYTAIMGKVEAIAAGESWSPTDPENGWDIEKIVHAFDPSKGIGGGKLFFHAQQYGFKIPYREEWVDPRDPAGPEYEEYERYLDQEKITEDAIACEKELERERRYRDRIEKIQKNLKILSYPIDLSCSAPRLCDFATLIGQESLPLAGFIFIKSPKNSGKSYQIKQLCEILKSGAFGDYSIINLTSRISLGRSQAINWVLKYIEDCFSDDLKNEDISLCINSIGKIYNRIIEIKTFAKQGKKTCLIMDEVELLFSHLITSGTIKNQSFILKAFRELIDAILSSGGLIIASDADLSNISVDYLTALTQSDFTQFIIENTGTPYPYDIISYESKDDYLDKLYSSLACNERIIIPTDGKDNAIALEEEIRLRFPDKKIICLHGDNSSEDWAIEMQGDIDQYLEREQLDVLIHTGSMGTGVSINNPDLFDGVFPMFLGIIEPDQARQMMIRYRSQIPRHLYCEKHGKPSRGPNSLDPESVKRQIARNNAESLALTDFWELSEDDPDFLARYGHILRAIASNDPSIIDNPHFDLAAKLMARKNGSIFNYREKLLKDLEEKEGCKIQTVFKNIQNFNQFSKQLTSQKQEILKARAHAIANADPIPFEMAQALNQQASTTEKERHQISKAFLSEELPELPLTGDFIYDHILKDRRKQLNGEKLLFLAQNTDYCHLQDLKHLKGKMMEFSTGDVNMASIRTYAHKVKLIKDLAILDLIGYGQEDPPELSQNSPEVQDFCDRLYFNRHRVKRCFGLRITKKFLEKPMQAVRAIASLLSLDLIFTHRDCTGARTRYYTLDREKLENPDRTAVMRSLEIRRERALEKEVQKAVRDKVSRPPNYIEKEYIERGIVGQSERFFDSA